MEKNIALFVPLKGQIPKYCFPPAQVQGCLRGFRRPPRPRPQGEPWRQHPGAGAKEAAVIHGRVGRNERNAKKFDSHTIHSHNYLFAHKILTEFNLLESRHLQIWFLSFSLSRWRKKTARNLIIFVAWAQNIHDLPSQQTDLYLSIYRVCLL